MFIDRINKPNIDKLIMKFLMADLYSTKNEEEELEDQIKLLQDAPNLDNDFKIVREK
jgi:hypothetical protein